MKWQQNLFSEQENPTEKGKICRGQGEKEIRMPTSYYIACGTKDQFSWSIISPKAKPLAEAARKYFRCGACL